MDDVVRFDVVGEARSDLISRIVGLVAQLGLVPVELSVRRCGGEARLTLVQDGIDPHRAAIVAEKMRSIVSVDTVEMYCLAKEMT